MKLGTETWIDVVGKVENFVKRNFMVERLCMIKVLSGSENLVSTNSTRRLPGGRGRCFR